MEQLDQNNLDDVKRPLYRAALAIFACIILVIIWALTAPLATTIHASGHLISAKPSHQLQHPYGGAIAKVIAKEHQILKKGDPILELDVSRQKASLAQIQAQLDLALGENKAINALLNGQDPTDGLKYAASFVEMRGELENNIQSTRHSVLLLEGQLLETKNSLEHLQSSQSLLADQKSRLTLLSQKGIKSKFDAQEVEIRATNLASEIADTRASFIGLEDRLAQTNDKIARLRSQFRLRLLQKQSQNKSRIPELKRQSISLADEIEMALITAPVSGALSSFEFNTESMFIPKGSSFATISRPLDRPVVQFVIPSSSIDQTHLGMTGTLTLSSLPQRNLPKIFATVTFISPDAKRDETGNVLGFLARAEFEHAKLEQALSDLQLDLVLSADMPASLALEGRSITFADYLVSPFFAIFSGALQD